MVKVNARATGTNLLMQQSSRQASAILKRACAASGIDPEAEISLLIVGAQLSRRYNMEHRSVDRATDVLSFPLLEAQPRFSGDFPQIFEPTPWLGDVVICLPVAVRQAQQQSLPLKTELAVLLVHGLMHLLGYDHQDSAAAMQMAELEMSVLAALGFNPEHALIGRALWF